MDASWISPALVGLGLVYNAWREAKKSGRREALQDAHETRLNKHSKEIDELQRGMAAHGERLGKIEARCEAICNNGV